MLSLMHEYYIRPREQSRPMAARVSEGPFIYMTSGQMATADNRFIYEVYLCSYEE